MEIDSLQTEIITRCIQNIAHHFNVLYVTDAIVVSFLAARKNG